MTGMRATQYLGEFLCCVLLEEGWMPGWFQDVIKLAVGIITLSAWEAAAQQRGGCARGERSNVRHFLGKFPRLTLDSVEIFSKSRHARVRLPTHSVSRRSQRTMSPAPSPSSKVADPNVASTAPSSTSSKACHFSHRRLPQPPCHLCVGLVTATFPSCLQPLRPVLSHRRLP
jgi:hypothetical protein